MSAFSIFKGKSLNKKRDYYCEEVRIFVQVHFVREKSSKKYAFNTLKLKTDPEREECLNWYSEHGNPDNFQEIASYYLQEKKLKKENICKKYNLSSNVFNISQGGINPLSKSEAVSICLGLQLNISQTRILLEKAGFALTNSIESDLVLRYCFENGIYDFDDVNYILKKLYDMCLEEIL